MLELHSFEPIFNQESRALILGSFPSLKSKEFGFYYGNSYNRFWSVLAAIFGSTLPTSKDKSLNPYEIIEMQKAFLLKHHIALWDCIKECRRKKHNSSDENLEIISVNNISKLLDQSKIKAVFCNGNTTMNVFRRYINLPISAIKLPSTSTANASYSKEQLIKEWSQIKSFI